MPLSQAIKVLQLMVKDQHIDKDIVDLFIHSGLVNEYADQHLEKSQVDFIVPQNSEKEKT
ncbi:MAG: hypothetical protein GY866_30900 [Proteobacteria bacterium]|nr:hypothetical protein [Pseudomonadota bacterium]